MDETVSFKVEHLGLSFAFGPGVIGLVIKEDHARVGLAHRRTALCEDVRAERVRRSVGDICCQSAGLREMLLTGRSFCI